MDVLLAMLIGVAIGDGLILAALMGTLIGYLLARR